MAQKAARKARQKQVEPPAAAAVPAEAGPSAAPGPKLSKKQRRKARLLEAKQAGALSAAEVEKAKQGAKKKKKSKGKNKRSAKTEYIHHDPPVRTSPPPKRAAAATAEVLIKDELASQVEANAEYQAVCSRPARLLDDPQRLLVVVDLNETLVLRTHNEWDLRRRRPVCAKPRPYLSTFLRWLGKIDCDLLIWSSAAQHNVRKLAVPLGYDPSSTEAWTNALPRLVGTWSRSDFGLSPREYAENVATRKDLAKVWAKVTQADGTRWSALNTVLLDNEADKAVRSLPRPSNRSAGSTSGKGAPTAEPHCAPEPVARDARHRRRVARHHRRPRHAPSLRQRPLGNSVRRDRL